MMLLYFHLGDAMYALKCDRIREVCPLVEVERVPHVPAYYAGLMRYRGIVIPVVDLRRFFHKQPCRVRLSTRIIVVDFSNGENSESIAGLMAEKVTEAKYRPDSGFTSSALRCSDIECLSSVLMENNRVTHLIDAERLFESLDL